MTRSLLHSIFVLALVASPAMASTFYVGTCHSGSFTDINGAVKGVAAGSVINVCPGTYVGQVIISKSLTLQGVTSQNSNQVSLINNSMGTVTQSAVFGFNLLPMIWVTAGTVNITNIGIDIQQGLGNPTCSTWSTGVFYASGTSGTVNHLNSYTHAGGCGIGVWAENVGSEGTSVKIENSYIDTDNYGILMASQQPEGFIPVLSNTISTNTIINSLQSIYLFQSRGTVSGNTVVTGVGNSGTLVYGIYQNAPSTTITRNTIYPSGASGTGVIIATDFPTVTGNKITGGNTGIDMGCHTGGSVATNTISSLGGLIHVPASFTGKNMFFFTPRQLTGGC